jgi:hypothetical protein
MNKLQADTLLVILKSNLDIESVKWSVWDEAYRTSNNLSVKELYFNNRLECQNVLNEIRRQIKAIGDMEFTVPPSSVEKVRPAGQGQCKDCVHYVEYHDRKFKCNFYDKPTETERETYCQIDTTEALSNVKSFGFKKQ